MTKLSSSPAFRRVVNEAALADRLDREQSRAEAANELVENETAHEADRQRLGELQNQVGQRIHELENDLAAARSDARGISREILQVDALHATRQSRLRAVMRETAPEAWGNFLAELESIASQTRAALRVRPARKHRIRSLLGGAVSGEESNYTAVEARLHAITRARDLAQALSVSHVGDPAEKIAEIRATIPSERTLDDFSETHKTIMTEAWLRFRAQA